MVYPGANHVELQAAYNPVTRLACATNLNIGDGIRIYDGAVGTYGYNKNTHWRYEVFAGYGYNTNQSHQSNTFSLVNDRKVDYDVSARYHKVYLQPAFGYFNSLGVYDITYSVAASFRASYNRFEHLLYRETDNETAGRPMLVNRSAFGVDIFTFEPCVTHKVGYRNIYGIMQLQTITPYTSEVDLNYTRFSQGVLFSLGLQYNLKFCK
jgi:hypothetical protein